ncbi:MAG TPA: dihydrofolate reductase family protein [Frankiaceae bacterium]|jgi:dihydrofolate reductase|nr:dihydrofolate reductase family protein [Frankiaceae bacterium]
MGRLVISTNVSLDGVVQDPGGDEGFARGGWFATYGGEALTPWAAFMYEETLRLDALLLGRRSDEWFGSRWNSRTDDWAHALNATPKYVISATVDAPVWANSTLLSGDPVKEAAKLKNDIVGTIVVYASYQLGRLLLDKGLVDEIRLFVFPVVLGAGERIFGQTNDEKPLRLLESKTIGDGLVYVRYEVTRDA